MIQKHDLMHYYLHISVIAYTPIADTGDCTEGVTVTVIGVMDDPLVILAITSINPDDSEPVKCPDVNSTTNTSISSLYKY